MPQAGAAIVTGASSGIGREIAKKMAAKGYSMVINYASDVGSANATVQEIAKAGGKAIAVAGDVSRPETAGNLFAMAEKEFDYVRVLINNAGVGLHKWTPLAESDDDTYNHIMEVNARGTFNMLREAARRMKEGGRIVNISSSLVHQPLPGLSLYTASKAAIESFTRTLALEMHGRNITVNCVAPGATATEVFLQGKSEELIERFVEQSPLGRLGTPEDIASVVMFLIGPEGAWINGQTLRANGGII